MHERLARRIGRGVALHEQHLRHVAQIAAVGFVEPESARHAEQVVERDGAAWIVAVAPLGHQGILRDGKLTVRDAEAGQGICRGLAHGPADLRRVGMEALCVTLRDDATLVDDDERAGAPRPLWVWLGEDGVDGVVQRRGIDAIRRGGKIDLLAAWPKNISRRRPGVREEAACLRAQGLLRRSDHERAAEAVAEDGCPAAESVGGGAHALLLTVDRRLEEAQKLVTRPAQLLREHVLRLAPGHEDPGA